MRVQRRLQPAGGVHCVSERQARYVLAAIRERMGEVGLKLHPEKTRIVYCQDDTETKAAQWVEPGEVDNLSIHPSMRRRITDALADRPEPHIG